MTEKKVVIVEYRLKNLETRAVEIFTDNTDQDNCETLSKVMIFNKYGLRVNRDYVIVGVHHATKGIV